MSNEKKETNVWERISKLWFMVGKMLLDGARDPQEVAKILQSIVDMKHLRRLFTDEVINFGSIRVAIFQPILDSTFEQMFGELGAKRQCWKNKEEALAFAEQNKDKLGPHNNFMELEGGFVASLYLDARGRPYISHVYVLSHTLVWHAMSERRVFYLQQ